jgi:GLPGLI family protein
MQTIIRTLFLLSISASTLYAQEFQGVATYKTKNKIEIELDSTMTDVMQEQIMAMLQKQSEKTFTLTFDKEQSIYEEDESLAPPSLGNGMMVMSSYGSDLLYKNIKEDRYTKQSDFLGKVFLIQDTFEKIDWSLQSDTKNIGKYTCFKATAEQLIKIYAHSDESTEKSITITAWYTPQIPVSNGPSKFQGLPGLILELSYDSNTILCSKVILNPTKPITIKSPKKGETVSQPEYDRIVEKKMDEMSVGGRGAGVRVQIEIMD